MKIDILEEVLDTIMRRYIEFEQKQELHLSDKEFKQFVKQLNKGKVDYNKWDVKNTVMSFRSPYGRILIKNRDKIKVKKYY